MAAGWPPGLRAAAGADQGRHGQPVLALPQGLAGVAPQGDRLAPAGDGAVEAIPRCIPAHASRSARLGGRRPRRRAARGYRGGRLAVGARAAAAPAAAGAWASTAAVAGARRVVRQPGQVVRATRRRGERASAIRCSASRRGGAIASSTACRANSWRKASTSPCATSTPREQSSTPLAASAPATASSHGSTARPTTRRPRERRAPRATGARRGPAPRRGR